MTANLNENNNGTENKKLNTKVPTQYANVFRNEKKEEELKKEKNPADYSIFNGSEYMAFEPDVFSAIGKVMRINSAELAKRLYARFRQTFHDLKGVYIAPVMNNMTAFNVEFFFQRNDAECGSEEIPNLENLATNNSKVTDVFERQKSIQNRKIGKTYALNNETKLLLSKYMYGGADYNKPTNGKIWNNDNIVKEVHVGGNGYGAFHQYGTEYFLLRVSGLNLNVLLAELFGKNMITKTISDGNGEDTNFSVAAAYQATFVKNCPDGTFMINITQFDRQAVEEEYIKENPIPQGYGGVQMYSI